MDFFFSSTKELLAHNHHFRYNIGSYRYNQPGVVRQNVGITFTLSPKLKAIALITGSYTHKNHWIYTEKSEPNSKRRLYLFVSSSKMIIIIIVHYYCYSSVLWQCITIPCGYICCCCCCGWGYFNLFILEMLFYVFSSLNTQKHSLSQRERARDSEVFGLRYEQPWHNNRQKQQ